MEYEGFALHHKKNMALLPGRGQGVGDVPSLKIIGDVDPSDISQGGVGGVPYDGSEATTSEEGAESEEAIS